MDLIECLTEHGFVSNGDSEKILTATLLADDASYVLDLLGIECDSEEVTFTYNVEENTATVKIGDVEEEVAPEDLLDAFEG